MTIFFPRRSMVCTRRPRSCHAARPEGPLRERPGGREALFRDGDFTPFWEFVAGPINAGTFGPSVVDRTFGPDLKYVSVPAGMKQNRPPSEGLQYFGLGRIDGATNALTVSLHDLTGKRLFSVDLQPA